MSFGRELAYYKIFEGIRPLTRKQQEKLLVGFYTEGVKDFPNGRALGEFLARVNNIDWFKPKETPDQSLLEELVQQHLSCLNLPSSPVRLIKEDWGRAGAARDTAWGAAWGVAWGAALGAARDATREAAWSAARDAEWGAARGAEWEWGAARGMSRSAEWIVVKDLMPQKGYDKGNPFEPLVEIFELGCWPIGIAPDQNGKRKFVVFIPPIQKIS